MTSKIFQKCLIIVPKVWEVTHNVFHHPWHIYQMDFSNFFSSSKDFTFDFSMSHCYTRYRSEEISPLTDRFFTVFFDDFQTWLLFQFFLWTLPFWSLMVHHIFMTLAVYFSAEEALRGVLCAKYRTIGRVTWDLISGQIRPDKQGKPQVGFT